MLWSCRVHAATPDRTGLDPPMPSARLAAQECVECDALLRQRLVAAYLVGYRIPLGMFGSGGCFRNAPRRISPHIICTAAGRAARAPGLAHNCCGGRGWPPDSAAAHRERERQTCNAQPKWGALSGCGVQTAHEQCTHGATRRQPRRRQRPTACVDAAGTCTRARRPRISAA